MAENSVEAVQRGNTRFVKILRQFRAIKIDSRRRFVMELQIVDYNKAIPTHLNCEYFCVGYLFENGDLLYIDEFGFLKNGQNYFRIDCKVLAGNGLILGTNCDAKMSIAELLARIKFRV